VARVIRANLSQSLNQLLSEARLSGIDQAQCCVIQRGEVIYSSDDCDMCFDIASLSKVISTVTLAAHGLSLGLFDLDSPISSLLADSPVEWREITIKHLLGHSSGLVAWLPFFASAIETGGEPDFFSSPGCSAHRERSMSEVWEAIRASPLVSPPGSERRYSDTGFIVLGRAIEQAFKPLHLDCDLSSLFERYVASDIGLTNTVFRTIPSGKDEYIAPTGLVRPRPPAAGQEGMFPHANRSPTPEAPGTVDDDNAYALGGIAGHAGLFSTARDVAKYGDWICDMLSLEEVPPVGLTLQRLCSEDLGPSGPKRTLGFDLPTPPNSSVGDKFGAGPKGAIGHLGFTGCSLWIDLDREVSVALLTNRVFPSRGNAAEIFNLRREVHSTVADVFPSRGRKT
jgi:CubicO group peptidase (beta-lactamase class C family)